MINTSVRVNNDVLDKARKHCKKNGIALTWYISNALKNQLEKEKVNGK